MLVFVSTAAGARAESLRIATFNAELTRKGPGLLLRDVLKDEDPQIAAFRALMLRVRPDIIALQGIDYDLRQTTLSALVAMLAQAGLTYPHQFSSAPNAGQASDFDLNGNGKLGDADDAHGYGRFNGNGGMAILSRYPIEKGALEDFTPLLWRDLPNHIYPKKDGVPFGGPDVFAAHRLSSRGHWVVPVTTPQFGTVRVTNFHATPPLYDGPEGRNGRRNHDEVAFWLDYLERSNGVGPLVLAGTANVDPDRGSGRRGAIDALLAHPSLQNPFDDTPTADFKEPLPGDLRVDYLLAPVGWRVLDHGMESDRTASRHSLLWIDIAPRNP